jgi:diaminohydroxyphosphoribosylaminopyrimidine deaminase/5-amino-6-(5-phosphoribosylamino)uracil reductase
MPQRVQRGRSAIADVGMTQNWDDRMREAIDLAQSAGARFDENPRVGCVLVAADGTVVGRGFHRGAGSPHAEVMALNEAGSAAAGATAVVSLEPCRHTGRTGPCTTALVDAGVVAVVFGQADPTAAAGGGAEVLRAAGVATIGGILASAAEEVNRAWTFAARAGRPMVTWKIAMSIDGRVARPDGGPTTITGDAARAAVHELRATVGAIVVGTGTALTDDPALTVRRPGPAVADPPIRVVMGNRAGSIPEGARVRDGAAPAMLVDERDPAVVLAELHARGVRHVLLEGGPTLATAFLRARLVDRVEWFVAPLLLGDGPVVLPASVTLDGSALGVDVTDITVIGEDVRVRGTVDYKRVGH